MTELTDALRELLEAYEARYPNAEAGMDAQTAWVMRQSRAREVARSLLASQAKQAAPIEQITPENTDGAALPADPCPGCEPGGTCNTVECGRKRSSELMRLYGTVGVQEVPRG